MEVNDIVALSLEFRVCLLNQRDNQIPLLLTETNMAFSWESEVTCSHSWLDLD